MCERQEQATSDLFPAWLCGQRGDAMRERRLSAHPLPPKWYGLSIIIGLWARSLLVDTLAYEAAAARLSE